MPSAVYPGSFDPPTLGHLDVIERASRLFPRLIVAVGKNSSKAALFSPEERLEMLQELTQSMANVEVHPFEGLLVEFAREKGTRAIVRGLRAISDFETEFQVSLTNRDLAPEIETVFLMTTPQHMFVSSSIVKEVASLGGDVSRLVPPSVEQRLLKKMGRQE